MRQRNGSPLALVRLLSALDICLVYFPVFASLVVPDSLRILVASEHMLAIHMSFDNLLPTITIRTVIYCLVVCQN
jgi:hypothetical protein